MAVKIDIEMPKACQDCPCEYDYIICQLASRRLEAATFTDKRPDWCPLSEIPEAEQHDAEPSPSEQHR